MAETGKSMVISTRWFQAALLTFLIGFSVLGYLAYKIYGDSPPIPASVVTADGDELFSGAEIMAGQHIFQKYGLMQYGTIFGHGTYLGPDFTAQYLHRAGVRMVAFHQAQGLSEPEAMGSRLTAFFAWAAWVASAERPGRNYSYTWCGPPCRDTAGSEPENVGLWAWGP